MNSAFISEGNSGVVKCGVVSVIKSGIGGMSVVNDFIEEWCGDYGNEQCCGEEWCSECGEEWCGEQWCGEVLYGERHW